MKAWSCEIDKKKKRKNTWKTLGQLIAYYGKFQDLLLDSFV